MALPVGRKAKAKDTAAASQAAAAKARDMAAAAAAQAESERLRKMAGELGCTCLTKGLRVAPSIRTVDALACRNGSVLDEGGFGWHRL